MKIVTTYIHPDEPCYGLREGPRMVDVFPNAKEWHWVQRVYVIRGDAIAEYTKDFGPDDKYEGVTEIIIPGFGDDSVAALQAHADKNREDNYWAKRRQEMLEGSTLIKDHIEQLDMIRTFAKRNPLTAKEIVNARKHA